MMSTYEVYVEELLKLQKCYRVINILLNDVVSKIDLIARPRVALTFALALWSVARIKQGSLSYSDVVYLQRRLAQFLSNKENNNVLVLKKLFDLIPMRYGMNISAAARRCGVSEEILTNIVKALNMLRDVIDMVSIGVEINEPLKHSSTTCLNDVDMLPPITSNPKEYLMFIINSLKNNINRIQNPVLRQVAQLINEEVISAENLKPNDIAAIVLIVKLLAENLKLNVICVEPSINMVTLSQKFLNDLAILGVDPYDSPFYKLYQEIFVRSVVQGTQKQ